jgi:hypothetical protein
MNFKNWFDSDREDEDEDGLDQSLNLGKNNEDLLSIFNRDNQIEDTDEHQNWNNNEDFISYVNRFKHILDIENMNNDSMMTDRYMSEDKEIKEEKEQSANDKSLDEINNLENKDTSNKTINKNNKIEKINPFNGPENEFICKKRKESFSIDNSNEKSNENFPNKKKINELQFKIIKQKENNTQKDNRSSVPFIKSFHTLLNIYFKYLVEEGNSFKVNVFDEKGGPNGYYISKDFTQSNLGAKEHSLKLDENITKFIKKEKLEKIKKKKLSLDILNLTARELIYMFYGYIFENREYFEKNEIIKKINQNFIRIRKYPFIDFENGKSDEKFKYGYFKYYD